ncbi:ATP-binding protein [Acinetobacter baumannii]|nr:ATP-binding protein [Acinetobacter baumannii]
MTTNKIKANPTKDFFITMLTRDIEIHRSVLDLIDNSVDAANLNDLLKNNPKVEITITPEYFQIYDNCGGMPLKVAENYAFRFGRPRESDPTPNSVGQFGVGMKRTLFKLGNNFIVRSKHINDSGFEVKVDVTEWKNDSSTDWEFNYQLIQDIEEGETFIKVENLYPSIRNTFGQNNFINLLKEDIAQSHFLNIQKGLEISLNGEKIKPYVINFYVSNDIQPEVYEGVIDGVQVKIIAGLSERNIDSAGWYIICNGRLVVNADQTSLTGWGVDGIRKYHAEMAFFRGVIELNAEDSSKLPWTTTKTGIDSNSLIYQHVLIHMKNYMRKIISILNDRTKEAELFKDGRIEEETLNNALKASKLVKMTEIQSVQKMQVKTANLSTYVPETTTIRYSVPSEKYEQVANILNVTQKSEVGLKTFNYFFRYEVDSE